MEHGSAQVQALSADKAEVNERLALIRRDLDVYNDLYWCARALRFAYPVCAAAPSIF